MRLRRAFLTGEPADPDLAIVARVLSEQLDDVFRFHTRVAFGPAVDGAKLENLDAYWVVHTFGGAANTDETVPHQLTVVPRAIINVETPLFNGTAPIVGIVTFGSVPPTVTEVTVRCSAASKVATFILIP